MNTNDTPYDSAVGGLLLEADEALVVFRGTLTFHVSVTVRAVASIVVVAHGRATIVAQEVVLLVVATAEELKRARVSVIADSFKDHVVTFLQSAEPHVFHGLHERQRASVGALCLLLQMHGECGLVVQVIAGPE